MINTSHLDCVCVCVCMLRSMSRIQVFYFSHMYITLQYHDGPLPITDSKDPIDREIEFMPSKTPYDPRHMLAGRENPNDPESWQGGFFDKDSFQEIMSAWAQTVVVGRARCVYVCARLCLWCVCDVGGCMCCLCMCMFFKENSCLVITI